MVTPAYKLEPLSNHNEKIQGNLFIKLLPFLYAIDIEKIKMLHRLFKVYYIL